MAKAKTTRVRRRTARKPGAPGDAITLLKADHREVKQWFEGYEEAETHAEKGELARKICQALKVHTQIEEEIFYPAARQATGDGDLLDEATVEHAGAKNLIAEIEAMKPGDALYDAKVKVLGEQIDHHVQEEETELFPEARAAKMDLEGLGAKLAARKQALIAEKS